ncbi:thiamine phosphate synthase [Aquimarina sp. TRL1]|uniref:thiamine phosphate synthase n=1 Tax=Aquimarina sp. (strain TRL1) TaxID=2736252 RepID=UPI00158BDA20|nr:thiamine phosphate synthase [Aquimarina sp. TRL1]QKX04461.1 thiamine phosphate synthase [Aquimarina sp. TRL1]
MDRVYYISQGKTPEEHLENIKNVCKGGCKWIQLRMKNVDTVVYLQTALRCREICDDYEAIMIVNDNVDVAKAAQADGIHLGLNDVSPEEARKVLGANFIIGGTANTFDDCKMHIDNGVDYIGLGPYRYTSTKENLSPVLGIEGYKEILSEVRNYKASVPVVAIGGIKEEDVGALLETKVSGVAVSGMLTATMDIEEKIKNINTLAVSR